MNQMFQSILILCCLLLALSVTACAPKVANRGTLIEEEKLTQIKAGVSNREDVVNKIGSPSQIGAFDENVWYYFGRQTEQYSFFDPEIVKQQALEIHFDDQGIVVAVTKLDPTLVRNDIKPVEAITPTYGHEMTVLEQLVGNAGRPSIKSPQK